MDDKYYEDKTSGEENKNSSDGHVYGAEFREYDDPKEEKQENRYAYAAIMNDPAHPKSMVYSIIALVAGILSTVLCCTAYGGLFFGVVAVVFAIVSKKHLGYFDTMTIVGLILGIFGFLFSLVALIISLALFNNESFWEEILKALEEAEKENPNGSGSGSLSF